eukprot:2133456-Pyramimonas_sp.AAC.1
MHHNRTPMPFVYTLRYDSSFSSRGVDALWGGRYRPGRSVKGTIAGIQDFGLFIKLSENIKALCPVAHLSDAPRSKISSKFEVTLPHPLASPLDPSGVSHF